MISSLLLVSWHPSATFPHHSLKTVTNFLRLRQYISWKELRLHLLCPQNSTPHYLHSALLCRKELHCWGSWLSFDMDSKVARISLNIGLSWITTKTGVTAVKQATTDLCADWTERLCSLLALLPSSFSWVQQNWLDSHSGWLTSERHPDKDKLLAWSSLTFYSMKQLFAIPLKLIFSQMFKHQVRPILHWYTSSSVINITTIPPLPLSFCQCVFITASSEKKAWVSDFNPEKKPHI